MTSRYANHRVKKYMTGSFRDIVCGPARARMMLRAMLRWFCHGIDTPKLDGEMISREASMMAVARLAFDTSVLDTLSRVCRSEGNTSRTQSAIRLAGSGWFSSL